MLHAELVEQNGYRCTALTDGETCFGANDEP